MMEKIYRFCFLTFAVCLSVLSCSEDIPADSVREKIEIYPDYRDVTIPYNIAPLNFTVSGISDGKVVIGSGDGMSVSVKLKNGKVSIPKKKWHDLLMENRGQSLSVRINDVDGVLSDSFDFHVADEPIDKYIAYRLIDPGYKLWGKMGIYQRDLESFRQNAVVESSDLNHACVNCHSFADRDPETMMFHVRRTDYGGTYVEIDGNLERLDTRTPQTVSALVYPSWHPDKGHIAFSVNSTMQTFHVSDPDKIEVYDSESDIVVYDVRKRKLLTSYPLFSKSAFETFPAFSNDGGRLYYCTADSLEMPSRYRDLRYSLCSIEFDSETASFGKTDTLIRAADESVTMPKISPDGRWLLYTSTEYGNFTVWHKDSDLVIYDLQNNVRRDAAEWNSDRDSDSWHSWSGNSRWVLFSSRRDDGNHTRLYIGYIAEDGTLGKAFMLPQKDPLDNKRLMKSYNIPEFVSGKVKHKGFKVRNADAAYKIEFAEGYAPPVLDAVTGSSSSSVN